LSVERRRRSDGKLIYRVRWREGRRNRVRTFDQLRDAHRFEIDVRRRKQLGQVGLIDAGRQTLDEFLDEWWARYAEPFLSTKTKEMYRGVWEKRISPKLGHLRLVEVTPEVVEGFAHELRQAGVGTSAIQKSLVVLQGAMKKAVLWGRITSNPVAAVTKPPQRRRQVRTALSPRQIETIRSGLDIRDATLVSVMAYAGLRPGEALALRWSDIRERTILVERAASLGEVKSTKTGSVRAVKLLGPLAADLAKWRLASGRPDASCLVFPDKGGGVWDAEAYKNWRRRKFRAAVATGGLPASTRPYDLRHAFCSLLIAEGRSIIEVAAQMGHAPTMTLDTYGHVIAEFDGGDHVSAEDAIKSARGAAAPVTRRRGSTTRRSSRGPGESPPRSRSAAP
jgi:integrase